MEVEKTLRHFQIMSNAMPSSVNGLDIRYNPNDRLTAREYELRKAQLASVTITDGVRKHIQEEAKKAMERFEVFERKRKEKIMKAERRRRGFMTSLHRGHFVHMHKGKRLRQHRIHDMNWFLKKHQQLRSAADQAEYGRIKVDYRRYVLLSVILARRISEVPKPKHKRIHFLTKPKPYRFPIDLID